MRSGNINRKFTASMLLISVILITTISVNDQVFAKEGADNEENWDISPKTAKDILFSELPLQSGPDTTDNLPDDDSNDIANNYEEEPDIADYLIDSAAWRENMELRKNLESWENKNIKSKTIINYDDDFDLVATMETTRIIFKEDTVFNTGFTVFWVMVGIFFVHLLYTYVSNTLILPGSFDQLSKEKKEKIQGGIIFYMILTCICGLFVTIRLYMSFYALSH